MKEPTSTMKTGFIPEIDLLQQSGHVEEYRTGQLLAKRLERLIKRQRSEMRQLVIIRGILGRLMPGQTRKAIAGAIAKEVEAQSRRALRITSKMIADAKTHDRK